MAMIFQKQEVSLQQGIVQSVAIIRLPILILPGK